MGEIIKDQELLLHNDSKIYWKNYPIAKLKKGNDYLSPEIGLLCDDALEDESKMKLSNFIMSWVNDYLNETLGDLLNLTKKKRSSHFL